MEQTVSDLIDLTDLRPETTPNAVGHQGDDELSDTGNSAVNNERTYVDQEGVESTASTTQLGVGMAAAAVDHENDDPSNIGHTTGETKLQTGGACPLSMHTPISLCPLFDQQLHSNVKQC